MVVCLLIAYTNSEVDGELILVFLKLFIYEEVKPSVGRLAGADGHDHVTSLATMLSMLCTRVCVCAFPCVV